MASVLTAALRTLVGGAALALVATSSLVGIAQAKPAVATPEVRQINIPAVAGANKPLVKSDGQRRAGRVVAALAPRATGKFSTLGVTWARGSQQVPQIEVRVRTEGSWTDWQLLEDESNSGPDGAEAAKARPGTAPIYVGDSDGVQVRLVSRSTTSSGAVPEDLSVSLIDPQSLPNDTSLTSMATTSSTYVPKLTAQPTVVSRAGWGADERLRSYNGTDCARPRYTSTIKAAIVHHTAGANSYTADTSAAQVRGIYAYHVKSQGWCDIGYNFLVDKFGTIFEGRFGGVERPVHGAHATYWNTDTVGVSLMGNFETAHPTSVMLDSTARLLAWKLEGNYRNAIGKVTLAGKTINLIAGHGDVMATACPGRNMRSRMEALRTAVAQRIGSFNTPIYRRWQALGGELGWVGSPVVGERVLGAGRVTRFTNADLYSDEATQTFWIRDGNRGLYRSLGETGHYLGWPISDQEPGVLGSQQNRFANGAIYNTPATGSQAVYGAFHRYYLSNGAIPQRLGLPIARQARGTVTGSQVQKFASGGLYWTRALSTREVNGAIYRTYVGLGAETSALGMPTRGDHAISTGRATDFQGGRITWNSSTNQTTVTYK